MTDINWNSKIKEALDRTDIMALSTIGADGSWTSPVQYTCDERLHFYFVSSPDAKHVRNILHNPEVSFAIYRSERPITPQGQSIGLQARGTAKRIATEGAWHRFEIIPQEIWYFDSRFKPEREKVDIEKINLKENKSGI